MTSYTTFIKHAEKVAKASPVSRPILKGVHHATDGRVVVTDSYRLYILNDGHNTPVEFTTDVKTGEKLDGKYPDINQVLPYDDDAVSTIILTDIKKIAATVKQLVAVEKGANAQNKRALVRLNVNDSEATITSGESGEVRVGYSFNLCGEVEGAAGHVTLNAQYLSEALALFSDAQADKVTIRIHGEMRPITLKSEDVTALILPVKTY